MILKIDNPQLKIIETLPSTLGVIDYYIVLYDKNDQNDNLLNKPNAYEIAEEIYETGEFNGFYVIQASSSRGEDIKPLAEDSCFCYNRVNCDAVLSYHILAIKQNGTELHLRSGFHEIHPSAIISKQVYDWNSMSNISNGFIEIEVNAQAFFKLYNKQIRKWQLHVTRCISNRGLSDKTKV